MKQITTSVDRIQKAGYWCSEADRETGELLNTLGKNRDDEIPVRQILNILGLSVGLISLGAHHPRYQLQANSILSRYGGILFRHIGTAFANLGQECSLSRERACYAVEGRDSLRQDCRSVWRKRRAESADPKYRSLCDAILITMSLHPVHIKLVHAGKAYLDAAPPLALVHLTADLGRMLDEPL